MDKVKQAQECFKTLNPHISDKKELEYFFQTGNSKTIAAFITGYDACQSELQAELTETEDELTNANLANNKLVAELTEHQVTRKELERQFESMKEDFGSPYCPNCGICGVDGCCSTERCKYPDIKSELVKELKADVESLNKKLQYQQKIIGDMNKTNGENFWINQKLESENAALKKQIDDIMENK